jgi:hypothetical protein
LDVTAAGAGRHNDFSGDAGPNLAALVILAALAVLNIRPFAVSGHEESSCRE